MPAKGRMGKVLSAMNPKNWLTHPMLIVPLYKDRSGVLREAPVANKYKGFKVSKPSAFVEKDPRMVQLGMLAIKVGIKIAAAQLAISVPAATLEHIAPATDGLINELLTSACVSMKAAAEDDESDLMESYEEMVDEALSSTFDAPNDAPDDALDLLLGNERFKELSKKEYGSFKAWLSSAHPGWEGTCGLTPVINPETGRAEWTVA